MTATRLRDSTKVNFNILFNELVVLSGAKFTSSEEVANVRDLCHKYLLDTHPFVTLEEIKEAYIVRNQGKYGKEIYKELSYVSICDVLLDYEEYKKEQIGAYVQNQTLFKKEEPEPLSENDARKALYEFFKESWTIASYGDIDRLRGVVVYDYLKALGLISLTDEEKKEIQEIAVETIKNEKEREKQESNDIMKIRSINHFLKNIHSWDSEVICQSKRLALSHQIRNWILESKTVEEFERVISK